MSPLFSYMPILTPLNIPEDAAMNLPDFAKPWPVRLTGRPDLLSPPNDDEDPGDDNEDGDHEKRDQNSSETFRRQGPCENERGSEENDLRNSAPTTRVLRELGAAVWEISVDEDGDPDDYGEEHHCPPRVLLLPEGRVESMGTPEGPDRVACEVDVDGGAYDGDEDYRVESGETPLEEGSHAGD